MAGKAESVVNLPDENSVSKALTYLAETDEPYAVAAAAVKAQEHVLKMAKALEYLEAEGPVAQRDAIALASDEYRGAVNNYENVVATKEIMANKRKRAELTIEVWRSLNAAHRRGNV